jgi:NAD(P)-dependent dehydrogenase (short-subunit alcohol dehydrogenase family)
VQKVAVVTGGSRGLGRALTMALAARGLKVYATGRDAAALASVAAAAPGVVPVRADVSDEADNAALAAQIVDAEGGLDVLIHNAGILGPRAPIADYPPAAWRRVFSINAFGVFDLSRQLIPILRPGASVQLVTSGVSVEGRAAWGAYSASKFACEGLAQIMAEELRPRGIRVNAVDPGSMRTAMRAAAKPEEDPMTLITPEENVACFVWLALDADLSVSGRRLRSKDPGPWRR